MLGVLVRGEGALRYQQTRRQASAIPDHGRLSVVIALTLPYLSNKLSSRRYLCALSRVVEAVDCWR